MATIVAIDQVIARDLVSEKDRRRTLCRLERYGQLEPLQVKPFAPGYWITHRQDTCASALVAAAKYLGWSTLLVVETVQYQA